MAKEADLDARAQIKQINAVILFTLTLNMGFYEILDYLI